MTVNLIIIITLIALSAVFSGTETAFTSISFMQIKEMENSKKRRARAAAKLARQSDLLLTTILIGNNLVNIVASALLTAYTIKTFGSFAVGNATGILTLVILIFAEITPKQIAIVHNKKICAFMAYPVKVLTIVLYPLIIIIKRISSFFTKFFIRGKKEKISLEGILHVVDMAQDQGVVEDYESSLVQRVFRFDDIDVHAIMTHRTEVFSLKGSIPLTDAIGSVVKSGFSRIPIYDETPEHIIGILLTREIMEQIIDGNDEKTVSELGYEPIFVPETRKAHEMFFIFKHNKLHLATVLDEYGGLAGIVTLEDVIEELFGELYDEHETGATERISRMDESTYTILGETPIQQVEDYFSISITHSRHVGTISGFIAEYLGKIPAPSQVIDTEWGIFKIATMKGNRINSLIFLPSNPRRIID
ncbi:MAG: hemolysin family protein [Spirochaetales bacterium]|jgi:putative hemolysin|nr:hemolysin family protein [Spirochaetales bacterium]